MDFVVIDVETANPDFSSFCQVGVAEFRDGRLFDSWESLVDPEDYFDEMNVSVHGIDETMVWGAPKWAAVHTQLSPWLKDKIVASHTAFDRAALTRACSKIPIAEHTCRWLDMARVVRRSWPEFSHKGYGLRNVAKHFGIEFQHHNAKEDARAAGEILLRAVQVTGLSVEEWLKRAEQPICRSESIAREGNANGSLFGDVLVFTGTLSMTRREAADLACRAGCEVTVGVTRHTTILVVGDEDIARRLGYEKSSKHRKAEDLMRGGQEIRIVGESDFQRLVSV